MKTYDMTGAPFEPVQEDNFRVKALESVLREREQELLEIKGPCSWKDCSLHYAHRGPCAIV